MPIVNGHVEYEIPEEILNKIPAYFYFAMAGELLSVFGIHIFFKWDDGEGNKYYDLDSSTGGWEEAFKATCKKLDMMWLIDYANTLEWYDHDIFDGEIENEIIKRVCEGDIDNVNPYYKYLIDKAK